MEVFCYFANSHNIVFFVCLVCFFKTYLHFISPLRPLPELPETHTVMVGLINGPSASVLTGPTDAVYAAWKAVQWASEVDMEWAAASTRFLAAGVPYGPVYPQSSKYSSMRRVPHIPRGFPGPYTSPPISPRSRAVPFF